MPQIRIACTGAGTLSLFDMLHFQGDLKSLSDDNYKKLRRRIIDDGFSEPISVWENQGKNYILNGHQRLRTVKQMVENEGFDCPDLPVSFVEAADIKEAKRKVLSLTSQFGTMEREGLYEFMTEAGISPTDLDHFALPDIDVPHFQQEFFADSFPKEPGNDENYPEGEKGSMVKNFLAPPFSVLDTKQDYWQQRKRAWLDIGLKSHLGRDGNLISYSKVSTMGEKDTSLFDPFLSELLCTWFCPSGGHILDPFAGGSVRGIVAGKRGFRYTGVDIRAEQVLANEEQAKELISDGDVKPTWITGDSMELVPKLDPHFNFLFSCPPYHNLEQYSDLDNDLSNLEYPNFMEFYRQIIRFSYQKLIDNSFACYVVGEIRDPGGAYRDFVGDTVTAFKDAGFVYYNEAVLLTAIGSLPLRAGRMFTSARKLGKAHQNVLIFLKGDAQLATEKLPTIETDAAKQVGGEEL